MRLGNRLAQLLDAQKPLFGDEGPLDLLPEEQWHPDCAGSQFGIPRLPQPRQPCDDDPQGAAADEEPQAVEVLLSDGRDAASGGRDPVAVAGFSVPRPQVVSCLGLKQISPVLSQE
jgi:hypothetical protein